MNLLKNIGRKALHGLYVAAGAVGTTLAATLVGGPVLGAAALAKLGAAAVMAWPVAAGAVGVGALIACLTKKGS